MTAIFGSANELTSHDAPWGEAPGQFVRTSSPHISKACRPRKPRRSSENRHDRRTKTPGRTHTPNSKPDIEQHDAVQQHDAVHGADRSWGSAYACCTRCGSLYKVCFLFQRSKAIDIHTFGVIRASKASCHSARRGGAAHMSCTRSARHPRSWSGTTSTLARPRPSIPEQIHSKPWPCSVT